MDDRDKTKSQLINEINHLRNELALLKRNESERKEANEALTKQIQLSQAFFDNVPCIALFVRAETYEVIASNKEAVKAGVLPGKTCYESWHKRQNPCPGCLFPKAWVKGEPQHVEMEVSGIFRDVYWIPVNENLYLHYAFDITERRKAEKEIRSLSLIAEQVSDSMLTTNLNFEITWANKSFQSLYGYSSREILGKSPDFLNVEPTAKQIQNDINQAISSGQVWKGEVLNKRKDGSTFPCELLIFPVVDEGGNIFAYAGHQRDITNRKRAEKALRESESLICATIESTADGILVVNEKGQVIQMNERFVQLWRIPKKLLETKDDKKLLKYVLNQLEEPEIFLRKVQELYKSADEECNTIKFKDGRIYERYSCSLIRENEICGRVWSFRDISERKRAEKALQESEEKFRLISEQSLVGIVIIQDEEIKYVNNAVSDLIGYPLKEMINWKPGEFAKAIHQDDKAFVVEQASKKQAGDKEVMVQYSYRIITKTGKMKWVEQYSKTIRYEGKFADLLIVLDITERKQAEENLRQKSNLLKTIFMATSDIFVLKDRQFVYKAVNPAFCKFLNLNEENIIGKSDFDLFPAPEAENYRLDDEKVVESGQPQMKDEEVSGGMGKRWLQVAKIPIIDETGACEGILCSVRDVTDRRRTEEALRKSESRHRELIERMPDGIYRSTPEGKLLAVNSALVKMLGYASHEDLLKMDIPGDLYFSLEDRNEILAKLQKNKNQSYIFRLKKKDGSELWVEERGLEVCNPDGSTVYYEGVLRDITERKRLQKELARAQRLETAGRIAGQIAHDFNNLLGPLAAYPTLIREDLPPGHPVVELVNDMEFAAVKIAEINQQLLSLGRRGHFTLEHVDLNDLLQKVVLSQNLPNELVVREELNSNLFLIKGGTAQLTRALINLIGNAKEAMQYSGVLTLRTNNVYLDNPLKGYKTISTGEHVKLEVSDIGSGIDPDIIERIFDPFFTTKKMDKVRGSGLGLSVVHSIVEDHNGYITVQSMPGKGTTFSLYFPVTRDKEIAETVEKVKGGHEKILVVDDDPVQRRVASHLLKNLGYKIHTVSSGEQAVKYVQKDPQDLLIIDMIMDGIDGTETYRQILEFQLDQKAVIMSGFALSQRVKEALRMGAGAFVTKPATLSVLATTVRKELDKKNAD